MSKSEQGAALAGHPARNPNAAVRVGKWTISYDPPPIPIRELDYMGVHDDFDGAPTDSESGCSDHRCIRGSSVEDVLTQITEKDDAGVVVCDCGQFTTVENAMRCNCGTLNCFDCWQAGGCTNPQCDRMARGE